MARTLTEFSAADTILPAQFFRRSGNHGTEVLLVRAIVEQALQDARQASTAEQRRHRAAALLWFLDDDQLWPFSFLRCCEYLLLDPEAVRDAVRR